MNAVPAAMSGLWPLTCANDLSAVSRSCRLMGPEVPEESQATPTAGGRLSALYGSTGRRTASFPARAVEGLDVE